jgi:esterase
VWAVDLRDHGRSPHAPGASTLDDLADDVAGVLEERAVGGGRVTLLGHSLGGKVAALLALRQRPPALARVVVVDIAPVPYANRDGTWGAVGGLVLAAQALDPSRFTSRSTADRALAASVPDAAARGLLLQNLVPAPHGDPGFAWRLNLAGIRASLPAYASFPPSAELAPPSAVEAHFIRGGESRFLRPAHEPAIRALFPNAMLHTVPGAGHWVHADRPREFVALLAAILQGGAVAFSGTGQQHM